MIIHKGLRIFREHDEAQFKNLVFSIVFVGISTLTAISSLMLEELIAYRRTTTITHCDF